MAFFDGYLLICVPKKRIFRVPAKKNNEINPLTSALNTVKCMDFLPLWHSSVTTRGDLAAARHRAMTAPPISCDFLLHASANQKFFIRLLPQGAAGNGTDGQTTQLKMISIAVSSSETTRNLNHLRQT